MKKLFCRYLVLFLVFWAGLAVRDSWDSVRTWWRHDGDISRLDAEMKSLQLEKKHLELTVLQGKDATDAFHLWTNRAKLKWVQAKDWIPFVDEELEIAGLEREIRRLEEDADRRVSDIARVEDECAALQRECDKARRIRESGFGRLGIGIVGAALLAGLQLHAGEALCYTWYVFLAMLALRLLCYYALAPLVERCKPVCPCGRTDGGVLPRGSGHGEQGVKLATISLPPGQSLLVRDESYTGGYMEYDDGLLQKRTQFLFSWEYWLMSMLCGLCLLTRFSNPQNATRPHDVAITSDDPDEYFSTFTIEPGQRFYITPSDLVAFTDGIRIYAGWHFRLPSWSMGQVRCYTLTGSGTVVVRAEGGITAGSLRHGETAIRKRHSLICASRGIRLHVRRTETLVPFLLGNASLFDLRLQGTGAYLIRNAVTRPRSLSERASHIFLESLGKFLGF